MRVQLDVAYMGGLGNQYFEIAAAISFRKYLMDERKLTDIIIEIPINIQRLNIKLDYSKTALAKLGDLKYIDFIDIDKQPQRLLLSSHTNCVTEDAHWRFLPWSTLAKSIRVDQPILMRGYFQSHKYFESVANTIRQFLKNDQINSAVFDSITQTKIKVGIHVRRGDYLQLADNHPPLPVQYYENAIIQHFTDRKQHFFIVFSDDIEWCSQQSVFNKLPHVMFIGESKDTLCMDMLQYCSAFIIANSTFSWWAAWLSSSLNKKVIAPYAWFGSLLENKLLVRDIIPVTWSLVSTLDSTKINTRRHLHKYLNRHLIESGSFLGDGIQEALTFHFPHVVSIEVSEKYYQHCVQRFQNDIRVDLHYGSSAQKIEHILKSIHEPATFFLDGHYSCGNTGYDPLHICPLEQELRQIAKHHIKTHTILIDDRRLMQRSKEKGMDGLFNITESEILGLLRLINPAYEISYEGGHIADDIIVASASSKSVASASSQTIASSSSQTIASSSSQSVASDVSTNGSKTLENVSTNGSKTLESVSTNGSKTLESVTPASSKTIPNITVPLQIDLRTVKTRILSPNVDKYAIRCANAMDCLKKHLFIDLGVETPPFIPGKQWLSGMYGYIAMFQRHLKECEEKGGKFIPLASLEDDIDILPGSNLVFNVPSNADLVFTGISCCGLDQSGQRDCLTLVLAQVDNFPNVKQVFNMLSTHAMLFLTKEAMQEMNRRFMWTVSNMPIVPWDLKSSRMQEYFNVYALVDPVFYQSAKNGAGDVAERVTKVSLREPRFASNFVSSDRFVSWKRNHSIGWFV